MSRFNCLIPLLLLASTAAHPVVIRHDVPDSRYLVPASEFPALVDLPIEGHGVLISRQWIVTAAHTTQFTPVKEVMVNGKCRAVAELIVHPGYRKPAKALESGDATPLMAALAASDDIALIKLREPIDDVTPVELFRGSDEQGKLVKLYGKGATGNGRDGQGQHASHRNDLRRAFNHTASADGRWLSYRFGSGADALALEGVSGNGDSGGPVLIEVDGAWRLAGLTSWNFREGEFDLASFRPGLYGQESKNVRISHYAEWIDGVISADQRKAGPDTGTIDPTAVDRTLQRLGSEFVAADRADGLSIALVKDGQVRFYNFGSLSREKPQAPSERTVYEVGSISKVFTSLLLAHAVTEGKVGLQDDIRQYLPGDYSNLEFAGTPVRVIDLATTTSALPDNLPELSKLIGEAGPDEAPFRAMEGLREYTNMQLFEDLKSAKLVGRPGAATRHSNVASSLLAIILEKVYGESYEKLLARYVEQPFGMASGIDLSRSALFAGGYNERQVAMPPMDARSILPAGGLRYSAADMAKFLVAELAASDAATRLSQKRAWGEPDRPGIGFNWALDRTIDGKQRLRTSGGTFGQASHIEMVPELGYGVVLLANRAGHTQNELRQLADKALDVVRGRPAVQIALEAALEKAAYRDAVAIIAQTRRVHPALHLTEDYVNQWAYRLLFACGPECALGLFQYNVEQWPRSSNAFDSLAEAYERMGDSQLAMVNYRRSLELNADNQHAAEYLKRLDPASR